MYKDPVGSKVGMMLKTAGVQVNKHTCNVSMGSKDVETQTAWSREDDHFLAPPISILIL